MNKFLKNYTSDVPVAKTIYNIEQVLIRCGVTGIAKEYHPNADVAAVSFFLDLPNGRMSVRLPANVETAQDALWLDYAGDDLKPDGQLKWDSRKRMNRDSFKHQAERTAWKIIQDWVEVQMSMIQMKQADPIQVFLPYMMVSAKQNYFEALKDSQFKGLLLGPAQ